MIVGTGMIARAFAADDGGVSACLFASGVSNSGCVDPAPFQREAAVLKAALQACDRDRLFVYFGTCSVYDPASAGKPYTAHKLEMEGLVLAHPRGLVIRLPQVAGRDASPYTLLSGICRSIRERSVIKVWTGATRNIIDVADVVKIVGRLLVGKLPESRIVNVASPMSYPIRAIVAFAEAVLGEEARLECVAAGAAYSIDIAYILPIIGELGLQFDDEYLPRVIARYYA